MSNHVLIILASITFSLLGAVFEHYGVLVKPHAFSLFGLFYGGVFMMVYYRLNHRVLPPTQGSDYRNRVE